jgi:hypothetical protein
MQKRVNVVHRGDGKLLVIDEMVSLSRIRGCGFCPPESAKDCRASSAQSFVRHSADILIVLPFAFLLLMA